MRNPKFIIALVVAVLVLILLFQNRQDVTLEVYFWKISMPQIIFMPILLLLGFVAGYLAAKLKGKERGKSKIGSQV